MLVAVWAPKYRQERWKKWESIRPPTSSPRDGRLNAQSYSRVSRATFKGQNLRPLGRLLRTESSRKHYVITLTREKNLENIVRRLGVLCKSSSRRVQHFCLEAATVIPGFLQRTAGARRTASHPPTDEDGERLF